jgi:hypothetical protein
MSSTDDRFGTYKIILRIERFGNYTKDQEIRRLVEWCRHKDHEENNKNEESSKD